MKVRVMNIDDTDVTATVALARTFTRSKLYVFCEFYVRSRPSIVFLNSRQATTKTTLLIH